jgi:hypothetical protein
MVRSAVSRASYGTIFMCPFDKLKHLEEDRYWCGHRGFWFATSQIDWYVKKVCCVINLRQIKSSPILCLLRLTGEQPGTIGI